MRNIVATFSSLSEGLTNRQKANRALRAMSLICGADCGTIRNPYELASVVLKDGRTIIQTINEDGYIMYSDGWYIVEVGENHLYVDISSFAIGQIWGENILKLMQDNEGFSPYKYVGDLA